MDAYPNCPRMTIYEANERDFEIVMIKYATSLLYEKFSKRVKSYWEQHWWILKIVFYDLIIK